MTRAGPGSWLVVAWVVAGCGTSDPAPPAMHEPVLLFEPDISAEGALAAPRIVTRVDGEIVGVDFCSDFHTPDRGITAGLHTFEFEDCFDGELLYQEDVTVGAGSRLLILAGSYTSRVYGVIEAPFTQPTAPAAGSAVVRVVHAALGRGPVDLYVLPAGAPVAGTPLQSAVPARSAAPFVEVPDGAHRIVVTDAGSSVALAEITGPITTLDGEHPYTLIFSDTCAGRPCAGGPSLRNLSVGLIEGGVPAWYFE